MSVVTHIKDVVKGKHKLSERRSPEWQDVRAAHLKQFPTCAICGGTKKIEVHHIKPFHLFPEDELNPANLISLCEGDRFFNCHRIFGHINNFRLWNPNILDDAPIWNRKIKEAHSRLASEEKSA